jgi:hypothetical protein
MLRTNDQNKRLYDLLNKLGIVEMKAILALQYSSNRTKKTSELTFLECRELIQHLEKNLNQIEKEKKDEELAKVKRKRSKVMHLAVRAGMTNEKGELNYDRFNEFMLKKSVLKKKLKDYSLSELDLLITQFNKIAKSYTK